MKISSDKDMNLLSCAYFAKSDSEYRRYLKRRGYNQTSDYSRGVKLIRAFNPDRALGVLETIVWDCEAILKTRSRDLNDWIEDVERIKAKADRGIARSTPEGK